MSQRLNVGCGEYPLSGYINIDKYVDYPGVKRCDFMNLPQPAIPGPFTEIRMDHVLEHFPYRDMPGVLHRAWDLLQYGGLLHVEVPNTQMICQGQTGPVDMQSAIYGVQDHPGEFHYVYFDTDILWRVVRDAGFADISVEPFVSSHAMRRGFPCIIARALKKD